MLTSTYRFPVTSLPPCWRTITKDSSLASIVSSSNMAAMSLSFDSLGIDCKLQIFIEPLKQIHPNFRESSRDTLSVSCVHETVRITFPTPTFITLIYCNCWMSGSLVTIEKDLGERGLIRDY